MRESSLELYNAMRSVITKEDPEGAAELFDKPKCEFERVPWVYRASAIRKCSKCGLVTVPEKWWRHCPDCGAEIEGAQED